MPRFYLHICNGTGFCEDEEGHDLSDAAAARAAAIRGIRDLLAGDIIEGALNTASYIEIEDEDRNLVATVSFEDAVRLDSTPCERPSR